MTTVSEVETELLIIGHVFESKAMKVVLYQPFGNTSGETLALFFSVTTGRMIILWITV